MGDEPVRNQVTTFLVDPPTQTLDLGRIAVGRKTPPPPLKKTSLDSSTAVADEKGKISSLLLHISNVSAVQWRRLARSAKADQTPWGGISTGEGSDVVAGDGLHLAVQLGLHALQLLDVLSRARPPRGGGLWQPGRRGHTACTQDSVGDLAIWLAVYRTTHRGS